MTGPQLWQTLLTTKVAAQHLKTLAYDLYYQKATAEGDASVAIDAFAPKLSIPSRFAYEALKRAAAQFPDGALGGDRRAVLESLAHYYQQSSAWEATSPMTKVFVEKAAHNVTVIQDAMAKQSPPPTAGGKPAVAHVNRPAALASVASAAPATTITTSKPVAIAKIVPIDDPAPDPDWKPQLMFFIAGAVASFILSIRNSRRRFIEA
jgi:hypothetical protein